MRYVGQAFEVSVDIKNEDIKKLTAQRLSELFAKAHHQIFEFSKIEGDPVEIISFRVGAQINPETLSTNETGATCSSTLGSKRIKMTERGKRLTADVKERAHLSSESVNGPMLIQDVNSTIFVPQEWKVSKDAQDNIILVKVN